MFENGSSWNKWDLHIHTPHSHMNGYSCSDEDFIQKIKTENIVCIGLTNYFNFCEKEFILKEKLEENSIRVLLNLELRLDYTNKDEETLDLHVLFSEKVGKEEINAFLTNLECDIKGNTMKLINLSSQDDFKQAVVNFDKVLNCLQDKALNLQNKYLIGFLSRGKGNARSSTNYEKIIKQAHFLIHSTSKAEIIKQDEEFWEKYNKPIIQSSDAHRLDDIGSKFSWIKAKPTFEGLKQIIYEPKRVYIGTDKPHYILHMIEKVDLDFDKDTKWGNEKFCFAGFKDEICFSPYLTCIIGGRGSGKSTLLNLIAQKISREKSGFFSKLSEKDIVSKIVCEPNTISNIDFLAQNEIEEFAKNSGKFTQAIFERLNKKSNGEMQVIQEQITSKLKLFDEQINRLFLHDKKKNILENKKKELKSIEYLLKTFTNGDFTKNYTAMDTYIKEQKTRLKWKNYYENFLQELLNIIQNNKTKLEEKDESPEIWTNDNYYKIELKKLNTTLEEVLKQYQNQDFQQDQERLKILEKEIKAYKDKIDNYLEERGYVLDNLNDLKNALSNVSSLKNEINELEKEINILNEEINLFNTETINNDIEVFNSISDEEIVKINELFLSIAKQYQDNIKIIKVERTKQAEKEIFNDICREFESRVLSGENISSTAKDYLSKISFEEVILCDTAQSFREKIESRDTQSYHKLIEIFSSELNFSIYKLLIQKYLKNIEKYKVFKVLYDSKDLEVSSFGQRCTAVIVILLSLGNNPIIMDEPEAHLDSSLIANYLVELIKQQKQQRQIIFATHNANFVLNADAELVIKLTNNDGNTILTSFSIEDIEYRDDLLQLEGGKEAFKKRERKYEID
ncbi:ATPase [Helicobacter didelphidarum]|uniref:ATPase n=1 Tax=Helicobacter didelphidarum TaxID=2040648 RepID=A0A3D8IEK1_9HELI|nr:AAA family ATPase [Helicobacter didelphidarum]RDU63599.1 ATPase [Helicobacter didelphidarum]